ncbi:MAG: histone deacetylase family protein [Litorimonas sp.]
MRIYYTDKHLSHNPVKELHRGEMIAPHEAPHRMAMLLDGLSKHGFANHLSAPRHDTSRITAVHSEDYVEFLQTAWTRWKTAGYAGDVLPMSYPYNARRSAPPQDIDGAAGYYSSSADTVITQTTWDALTATADCALSAANSASQGHASFALIRPPGHHAGATYMSGYCLLNNSAIAAQALRDNGAKRVAILDVDFHHGNGTQDIFYARDDVFFTSIHGHPDHHFPYFWGHEDETGTGAGAGFTANYPLPPDTDYSKWSQALTTALRSIATFKADALVVSLGVDTFEHDPISAFKLKTQDFAHYGAKIAKLGLPTCFIMEGGYGVPEIGDNIAGVLRGFSGG